MKRSFIERIFPHSPGSANILPQYEDGYSVSPPHSVASPPRILLRESPITTASSSPDRRRNLSRSESPYQQKLSSSLVRHDDPFLPVERAAKILERMFQKLLDAQSEGLSAGGVGMEEDGDDISSVGSPTPTPSVATTPLRSGIDSGLKIVPIRQPKVRKITLRGARRGLEKSMREFAALKQQELALIEREVVARDDALKQASDLDNRRQVLQDEISKIKSEGSPIGLKSEVQVVEREIQNLENVLLELRSKHRVLLAQLREVESSKDSEISSYRESLALSETQVKSFLRRPPVPQSLANVGQDAGMYALKPERRTLHMAQEQWTSEMELLAQRKLGAENERVALEEGSQFWHAVVQRIRDFEKDLKTATRELETQAGASSFLNSETADPPEDTSMQITLSRLSDLVTSLEGDFQTAESKNWNLLVCAIGAELAAFEQARNLLRETAGLPPLADSSINHSETQFANNDTHHHDDGEPSPDLLSGQLEDMLVRNGAQSPGGSSNHSLEATLREFGSPLEDKGKQKVGEGPVGGSEREDPLSGSMETSHPPFSFEKNEEKEEVVERGAEESLPFAPAVTNGRPNPLRRMASESEDDEPGPEFLVSHA